MKKRIFAMLLVCALAAGLAPVRARAFGEPREYQTMSLNGYSPNFIIKDDNALWGWGDELGTYFYNDDPVKIMDNVMAVSATSYRGHALAIKTDGTLWSWGDNFGGELGDGTRQDRSIPAKIMDSVVAASVGDEYSLAIKADGTLWTWGENSSGQLGDGTTEMRCTPVKIMEQVQSIRTHSGNSYAIKTDGSLWAWGANYASVLGDGTDNQPRPFPVKIMENVKEVVPGITSYAIKNDNSLWGWGWNANGEVGDGTTEDRLFPVKIMDDVVSVSVAHNTVAVKTDGTLWAWGRDDIGDLYTSRKGQTPLLIMDQVVDAHYDGIHVLAIKADGSLWSWGEYEYYSYILDSDTPKKIMDDVICTCGGYALKTDGSLWKIAVKEDVWGDEIRAPVKIMDNVKLPKGTSGITQTTLTEKHYPGTVQTVPSTWAEAEVNNARDNGLVPSELDGNYTGNITRAEFCNLGVKLVKSLGKENRVFNKATVVLDGKGFSDTDDENVITMCNAGVVNGYTDGRFGPNDPITREQAAVMLARLARKLGGDLRNGLEPQYRDGLSISAWAREDVAYISRCETAGHKAVMGGSNGYFSPKNYYTREQAFLTFQRLYECATNTASGAGTSSGRIEPENNMEKGEQALAQRAVELVQTLSDQAKAKEANPFLGQEDQLEALKKTIHVTSTAGLNSDKDIPDAVYYAFAGAIYEAMEDSSIEKLEYDGNKLVNQIYDAVKNGLLNGTKTVAVTTGKGKNRTTTSYTVTYRITALAGAQTSEATVSWNNGSKRVLLTSADVAGTQKALANFCAALAQLNKEAWNEFLSCYFGNAFGLMGFDIKKDDVKKALSVSEKVIKAIDDPREADKFLAEAGDELSQSVKDQLKSGWFDSEIGKLVKECVPNGDKIVEAAKVYLKAREKYDAWTSAVEARKNMDEVQKLYADFSGVLSELDSILNEIAP